MQLLRQTLALLTKYDKILTATASLVIIGTAVITIFDYARYRATDLISNLSYFTSANPDAISSFLVNFVPYFTSMIVSVSLIFLMSVLANRVAESTKRQITNHINKAIKTDIVPQLDSIATKLAEAEEAAERLASGRRQTPKEIVKTGELFSITGHYTSDEDPTAYHHFKKGQTAPPAGDNGKGLFYTTWTLRYLRP